MVEEDVDKHTIPLTVCSSLLQTQKCWELKNDGNSKMYETKTCSELKNQMTYPNITC